MIKTRQITSCIIAAYTQDPGWLKPVSHDFHRKLSLFFFCSHFLRLYSNLYVYTFISGITFWRNFIQIWIILRDVWIFFKYKCLIILKYFWQIRLKFLFNYTMVYNVLLIINMYTNHHIFFLLLGLYSISLLI